MTKKRLISTLLILIMVLTIIPSTHSQAKETEPNAPVISVKSVSGKSGSSNITITIEKTTGAQGYKIMLKAPGEKKFKSVKTLKKDGTAVRSYTVTNVSEGKYSFKVKAYTKTKSKTVWSKYSKTQTVSVSKTTSSSEPISISIILPGKHGHLNDSSKKTENKYYEKLVKDIETYTNSKLDIRWEDPGYYSNLIMEWCVINDFAPDIFIVSNNVELQSAVDSGLIWDLTPYIDEYDNLSTIPAYTRQNASYNGRMYCIPRSVTLARAGFGYRLDWLNNLGLKEPETWDDFKAMLYAFTYNDPDGNGIDDTVGLGIDSWNGAFNIMMTWFGVPNEWGLDAKGNLINKVETKEYIEALKAFRELVETGVINYDPYYGYYFSNNKIHDFRDIRPGNARTDLINTGLAGCSVQYLDALRLSEEYFEQDEIGLATSDKPIFKLQGYVDTGKGALCLPTTGMSNMIVISKKNIKTEDQLRQVLQFLNDINDGEMLNLIDYGYEGVTWKKDGDGHISQYTSEQLKKKDLTGDFRNGFNQLASYYTAPENNRSITLPQTKTQILEQKLYEEDIKYIVLNYGIGYTSMTYIAKGWELDHLIAEAQLDFIVGEIDEAELKTKIKQWKENGGDEITKEMNKLYHKNNK